MSKDDKLGVQRKYWSEFPALTDELTHTQLFFLQDCPLAKDTSQHAALMFTRALALEGPNDRSRLLRRFLLSD